MIDPYRMVLVNIIASGILIVAFLFYKYVCPKKTPPYPLVVFMLSLLPLISLLRKGSYESGDLWIHIARLIDFYNSLKEGILIPNWAANLNATYGYPIFIFDAPLQYYISSIFHFLGFSFIGSIKLLIAISFIISAISMFAWMKNKFGEIQGLVGAIFYMYAPYHLVNMHFRVSVGELLLFSFVPMAFFTADKLLQKITHKWFAANSILIGLMVLASPTSIIVFTFLGFYLVFFLYKKPEIEKILTIALSYFWGLLLSSFYWLPVFVETKFTYQPQFHSLVTFQSISDLLYKSYRFGLLYQGRYGELSFIVGFIQILLIVVVIYYLIKGIVKKNKRHLIFFLVSLLVILFLITPYSKLIWVTLPLYNNLQFSYRLMLIVSFVSAAIIGIISINFSKKVIFLISVLAIISTILNWGNRKTIPELDDKYFRSTLPYATARGEGGTPASPKWSDPKSLWQSKIPQKKLEIVYGEAKIKKVDISNLRHMYNVGVIKKTKFKENTLYFPGWELYANDKQIKIDYKNPSFSGVINFNLDPGDYKLELIFKDTLVRKLSKIISLISAIFLIGIYLVRQRPIKL